MLNRLKLMLFYGFFATKILAMDDFFDDYITKLIRCSKEELPGLFSIEELPINKNLRFDDLRWANDRDLDNDQISEVENEPQFKYIPISNSQYYLKGVRISHLLGERQGMNWLDLGAGQAKQLFTALDLYPTLTVTGLAKHIPKNYKVIQEKIKTCNQRFRYFATPKGFEYISELDLEILGKQSYDLITDYMGAIHYSSNPQDSVWRSLELLKKGGRLIIAPFQADQEKGCLQEYKKHQAIFQQLSEDSKYEINYYQECWYIIIAKKN